MRRLARAVGIQSYTYRRFGALKMVDEVKAAGLEAIELWPGHLPANASEEQVAELLAYCAERGIGICGYGVVGLGGETESHLRMAKRLGCSYVSVDVRPHAREAQAAACRLAEELGLHLGIHNHGPGHHYSSAEDVAAVLKENPAVLGACVDTGHFLRSNVDPVAAIELLQPRVYAVHLKDFIDDRTEVQPGTGRLHLPTTLAALVRAGMAAPFVMEYEADEHNPTPAVRTATEAVRAALPAGA